MSEQTELMNKPIPKHSIIIINHDGLRHTKECIDSIFAHTKDFELIVVDNFSDDGSRGYLDEMIKKHANLFVVFTPKKYNFSTNNNFGLQIARGDYITFLNNDTKVTENWLDQMEAHFNNVPLDNIGAVGPVCNMSNGRQMVGLQDPAQWNAKNKGKWSQAGVLYGWCMMFKKQVLEKIGGFDPLFDNAYEDNDLSLRAVLAGYSLVIAYDTFIFHEGQATLRKELDKKQYLDNGLINRERYYDKWYSQEKKKLVAVYRTNWGKHLHRSLEQTSKFADQIILHFCRAPQQIECLEPLDSDPLGRMVLKSFDRDVAVARLIRKFPKITFVEFYDGIFQEDYERNRLLQIALQYQAEGIADWCISIDDDEIYEDKFIGRVQAMMNPRNPEVMAYQCNWRTIWKEELGVEYYRADSTFGRFINYRFFRLIPGQVIRSFSHPEGHHCGSAPIIPPENVKWCSIRVKHLGYDTPEQRQKKFEFYQENDHFKRREDIGNDDYSHLIDKNVEYQRYDPDLSISCVMMVKNEREMILACLEQVENLVDEFVIVDTGSSDDTVDIVKKFGETSRVPVHIFNHPWVDNYSIPRNFGKSNATGKYILRLDADERFQVEHIQHILELTERDYDYVSFHVLNYMQEPLPNQVPQYASTESTRLYRNIPELFYNGVIHETLDDSLVMLSMKRRVFGERAGFPLHHYGYLKDKKNVRAKLDYYETLNNKQIEVTEGLDPRPYFNLALHYLNDGKENPALKAFQQCLTIDPRMWHASQQMAALNIKSAKVFLANVIATIPQTHPFRPEAIEILEFLEKRSIGAVKVD